MCLERPVNFKGFLYICLIIKYLACPSELWFHQLSSNNQCKDDVPESILDLDKAMERVKQKEKIQDRQTELEINARKLTEEERTIEEVILYKGLKCLFF